MKKILILLAIGLFLLIIVVTCTSLTKTSVSVAGGVVDNMLVVCPPTPNCVSSVEENQQTQAKQYMPPLILDTMSWEEFVDGVLGFDRTTLIQQTDVYAHITFQTPTMKFIDDVEFLWNEATKEVFFRSASRVGKSDIGTNKRRMKAIIAYLQERE